MEWSASCRGRAYGRKQRFGLQDVAQALQTYTETTDHEFWPGELSICDRARFHHERILSPRHLTDVYLLALAVERAGRLVTFDRGIPLAAVAGAEEKHAVALSRTFAHDPQESRSAAGDCSMGDDCPLIPTVPFSFNPPWKQTTKPRALRMRGRTPCFIIDRKLEDARNRQLAGF